MPGTSLTQPKPQPNSAPQMRVALIGPYPINRPPSGGVESVNRAMTELLLEQSPNLHITVLTFGQGEDLVSHNGRLRLIATMPTGYRMARLRGYPREGQTINDFVAKLPAETLVHSSGHLALHAVRAAAKHGLRSLVTIHGILERDVLFEPGLGKLQRQIAHWQMKHWSGLALRQADAVIAISSYSAQYAQSRGRRGPTQTIANPLDQRFEGQQHPARSVASTLLYVGNVLPLKGLHVLLEAFAKLCSTRPNLKLRLAGPFSDEDYSEDLRTRTRDLGLESRVHFLGPLSKERVFEEMQNADLLVLPSLQENLPQVLQEAGSIGLPFVASDVGGIKDFVPKGLEPVLLSKANDPQMLSEQLALLLDDEDKRRQTATQLQQHLRQHFSNASIAAQTLEIFADGKKAQGQRP